MPVFHFRLQAVLDRRVEAQKKAEEALSERQKELAVEQQTLKSLEKEANRLTQRYSVRRTERLVKETRESSRLGSITNYLFALELDMQAARSSVLSQQLFVDQAQEAVEAAQQTVSVARREVEVLEKYRDKEQHKFELEIARQEELELDEIGNVMFISRHMNDDNL